MRQTYVHHVKTSSEYPVKRKEQVAGIVLFKANHHIILHPFNCMEEWLTHSKHLLDTFRLH